MKALTLIRAQGLRHRMEAPALFIRRMNILAMEMTHIWNQKDSKNKKNESKKQRKKVLRKMDKLVGYFSPHRNAIERCWTSNGNRPNGPRGEADACVLRRLDHVLTSTAHRAPTKRGSVFYRANWCPPKRRFSVSTNPTYR